MDIVERLFVLIQRFPTEDPAPGLKCFVADTEAYAYPCREEVEIVERIFDQVLGTFPEIQHLEGLSGCVAVANRNHRDHVNLVEADVAERCHFKTILEDPAELYASDEVQRVLRDNMTIKKLILKLDSLFHNFIVTHWKPSAIGVLTPLQEQAEVSDKSSQIAYLKSATVSKFR